LGVSQPDSDNGFAAFDWAWLERPSRAEVAESVHSPCHKIALKEPVSIRGMKNLSPIGHNNLM
jgi:hypothetical protein